MNYEIQVRPAHSVTLAAVRVHIPVSGIAQAWGPALDKVWNFLRLNRVPNTGLNVFLYHHSETRGDAMNIDFGVEVTNSFHGEGDILRVETPSGEVAETVHVGPYDRLGEAHAAIHRWCKANQRQIAGASWEIYGHGTSDPEQAQTTIRYLLS